MKRQPKHSEESTPTGKAETIRVAVQHNFPTADIETMLAEIGRGYEPFEQSDTES